jgi:TonB family protein
MMFTLGLLSLAALGQATAPSGAPSVITNPDWQRLPTGQDMSKYYPKAAMREDLAGRALLTCSVAVDGRLTNCTATQATPEGSGFGEAAVAMSEVFRMRPQTKDGKPVAGGFVRIPINFIIPANLRAAPVPARHPDVKAEIVELDCRFRDLHLDNCFARGASNPRAYEVALKLAEDVTLPPLPTKRRQGRIVLPLVFTDASGGVSAPDIVTRPVWHERPTIQDVYRAFPAQAKKDGVVGNVVVECRMEGRGPLGPCTVLNETPAGQGFGAAALTLMPRFKADEVDAFGLKVAGRKVRIPIRFSAAPPPTRGTGN